MKKFENESGKNALWQGVETKEFKNWKNGIIKNKKNKERERITILVSEETKNTWQDFMKKNEFPTISKFLREGANFYINNRTKISHLEKISDFSHDLKEPLTSIKGFSQIIIENYSDKLDINILLHLKEIYAQSLYLEQQIDDFINKIEPKSIQEEYDILIVEDDAPTIKLLQEYFKAKGYTCKGVTSGFKGLEELKINPPKLILLDILLPDISGYEICKQIKSDKKYKDLPIYYITAIRDSKVSSKIEETRADGYFLKPFDFSKFSVLFNYL